MKDRYFYPLAFLIVIGIYFAALIPGVHPVKLTVEHIRAQGFLISKDALRRLNTAQNMSAIYHKDINGTVDYAVLSTNLAKDISPPSAGIFALLGPNYRTAFNGENLRITIVARAHAAKPLSSFEMAYFSGRSQSPWQTFSLSRNFTAFSFQFKHQGLNPDNPQEIVGIWPGLKGDRAAMEVKQVRIEIMEAIP